MKNIINKVKKNLKNILVLLVLVVGIIITTGCSKSENSLYDSNVGSSGTNVDSTIVLPNTDRKITYTADVRITSTNLSDAYKKVQDLYPANTWTSEEQLNEYSYSVTIRVKTESFDSFLNSLNDELSISSVEKTSEDITSSYNILENKKEALQKEYERLIELMDKASAEQIATYISPRITEVESELLYVNHSLSEYDERLEYSIIYLRIAKEYEEEAEPTFFEVIKDGFFMGFKGLGNFLKYGIGIILVILPTGLIVGLIVFGIYKLCKKTKKGVSTIRRKEAKDNQNKEIEKNTKDDIDKI